MRYLSVFANSSAYNTGKQDSATFGLPHVSLIESDMSVIYDPYVAPVAEPEEEPSTTE